MKLALLIIFFQAVLMRSSQGFQPPTPRHRAAFALNVHTPGEHQNDEPSQTVMDRRKLFASTSVGMVAMSSLLWPTQSVGAEEVESMVVLHIADYPKQGVCGQVETTEQKAYFAKTFGGLKDGSCAVDGFTKEEGTANGINEKDKQRVYTLYGK